MGNHDLADEVFWENLFGYPQYYNFSTGDYAFLLANTSNSVGDYLCTNSSWIQEKLDFYSTKNVFIFMHITQISGWTIHGIGGIGCPEFQEVILNHSNVVGIFQGHDHNNDTCTQANETTYCWDGRFGSNWGTNYMGYRIVEAYGNGTILTYQIDGSDTSIQNSDTLEAGTSSSEEFTLIGTDTNVANNSVASQLYSGLEDGSYNWLVNITDGQSNTTSGLFVLLMLLFI